MSIAIITSSYPAFPEDPSGTAGLFVREFALELSAQGEKVIILPVGRKDTYTADPGLTIEPIPWGGGDQELASLSFCNPKNWKIIFNFFTKGKKFCAEICKKHDVKRILCMWVIPSGVLGHYCKKQTGCPYDVWALGSDIWRIRKIPFLGPHLISSVINHADNVFADGLKLCEDVTNISKHECTFLPSCRKLPKKDSGLNTLEPTDKQHFLFVGRYHENKGPDLLVEAWAKLKSDVRAKTHLHIFGLGPLLAQLINRIEELNLKSDVTIKGPIDAQQLSNYLARVKFLIIPSRIESIPVIFSDAMQMDTPVISMPVGDLTQLINTHNCGLLADNVDANALAEKIEEAVEKGTAPFQSGINNVKQKFLTESAVKQWLTS